jgi:Rab GDP dissociation inhibitor
MDLDVDEVLFEGGKVSGIKNAEGVSRCSMVVCDPTYAIKWGLGDRVKLVERVIRCICILDHPIPNTGNVDSAQIIIPQKQVNRKNGIS